MKKKTNATSRRTIKAIRVAFADLISEKGSLNKITISDLVRRAGITRGTFYNHYDNIYQVAADFQKEILGMLFKPMDKIPTPNRVSEYFDNIFEYLEANEDVYRKLLSSDAPIVFINQLSLHIAERLLEILQNEGFESRRLTLDVSFFTDGAVFLILKYFRGEINLTLLEVKDYLKKRFIEIFIS